MGLLSELSLLDPFLSFKGVRLILRLKMGEVVAKEMLPEGFPSIAQDEGTKSQNSLAPINGPAHAGFFHPCPY